jgi:glycosyltransferase involved in cell wall biosynthesis
MKPILSIVIPTFNRNETLKQNLLYLLPQLTDNNEKCELIILDNHSDVPVVESISDLLVDCGNQNISVIRHPFNLGMSANILRAFEVCNGSFLWILGDDDRLTEGALNIVLNDIQSHNQITFLNYTSSLELHLPNGVNLPSKRRSKELNISNIEDFTRCMDPYDTGFISVSIFNSQAARRHISTGYMYANTLYPHVGILLKMLQEKNADAYLSPHELVYFGTCTSHDELWSRIYRWKIFLFLDLLDSKIARINFINCLIPTMKLIDLALILLLTKELKDKSLNVLSVYTSLSSPVLYNMKSSNILMRFEDGLNRVILTFSKFSFIILSFAYWLKSRCRRKLSQLSVVSINNRI